MDTRTKVVELLTNYHELKRSLDLLVFRIEHFSGLSTDKVIEELTFKSPEGERVSSSGVTNKTARIALEYQGIADDYNEVLLRALLDQYRTEKSDLDMLEYCITLLEPKLAEVITDMFINKLSWAELGGKYYVSVAMIGKYRKKGMAEICRLYEAKKAVHRLNVG